MHFADNPKELLEAYAESGEGIDRAGGFAAQVRFADYPLFLNVELTILFAGPRRFINPQGRWRLSKCRRFPRCIILQIPRDTLR